MLISMFYCSPYSPECVVLAGLLDTTVSSILSLAEVNEIPIIFALTKSRIGQVSAFNFFSSKSGAPKKVFFGTHLIALSTPLNFIYAQVFGRKARMCAVSIINYDGANKIFKELLCLALEGRKHWQDINT